MTIQKKATLIIIVVFVTLVSLFLTMTHLLLKGGFASLENSHLTKDAQRIENAVSREKTYLLELVLDWGFWDNAYSFTHEPTEDFIESDLIPDTFLTLDLDSILFIRNDGEVIFAKQYNEETEDLDDVPPEIIEHFDASSSLLKIESEEGALSGFIEASGEVYLFAVSPVLRSDSSGSPNAVLVMFKKLNQGFFDELSELLQLDITAHTGDELRKDRYEETIQNVQKHAGFHHHTPDDNRLVGYGLINNLENNPLILYQVDVVRDIYRQGFIVTYRYMLFYIIVAGLVFAVVMILLLQNLVIKKIEGISRHLKSAERDIQDSEKASILGEDEITALSTTIDETLARFKKTTQDLGNAKKIAEKSNLAKTEFISHLSHELRTPVGAIMGFAEISRMDNTDPGNKDNLDEIINASGHLLKLLDELLDTTRLETGAFSIQLEPTELSEIIQNSVSLVGHLAAENSIQIDHSNAEQIEGLEVNVDPKRLKQVILNLLSNAVKYNREGGKVFIEYDLKPETVVVKIRDTGQGVEEDLQERIFDAYERGAAEQSSIQGHGIGLHLCNRLVNAMSCKMGFETEQNVGSVFWVELPIVKRASDSQIQEHVR